MCTSKISLFLDIYDPGSPISPTRFPPSLCPLNTSDPSFYSVVGPLYFLFSIDFLDSSFFLSPASCLPQNLSLVFCLKLKTCIFICHLGISWKFLVLTLILFFFPKLALLSSLLCASINVPCHARLNFRVTFDFSSLLP